MSDVLESTPERKDLSNAVAKMISNSTVTRSRPVLHGLRHNQQILFYHSQPLSALPTKSQSKEPAAFLANEFDGAASGQRDCRPFQTHNVSERECCTLLRAFRRVDQSAWDYTKGRPGAASAAVLILCAKLCGSITNRYECSERTNRTRGKDEQT